jgi:transcriptional regulator with GAF, ATPase, and Fis domain
MNSSCIRGRAVTQLDIRNQNTTLGAASPGRQSAVAGSWGDAGLHLAIAECARDVRADSHASPDKVIKEFVLLATTYLRGVTHAGAMLVTGKQSLRASPASTAVPQLIDEIQEKLLDGPCMDAVINHQTIRVDDLREENRWPLFRQAVLTSTPVRSFLTFPLHIYAEDCGALSIYADTPHAIDFETEQLGELLACHAALALSYVRRNREVRAALGNRDLIGQAKGKLMERYDISGGAAFGLLARLSAEAHKPVVAIAKEVIEFKHTGRQ